MRRAVWFATVGLVAALVQAAPVTAHADVAAPVVTPADGSALSATSAVFTATYDVIPGDFSRLGVRDAATGVAFPCADQVPFADGDTLRCAVRDLTSGA